jgi:ferric-dicitrate binding protein FerR (iron transport regulator)
MNREELFDKHLRGELSAEEMAELKRLLASDANTGRAFVEHVNETTLLVRVGSQFESARMADNVVPLAEADSNLPSRRSRRWAVAAMAACLAVLAAGTVIFLNRKPPEPVKLAEVYAAGAGVQVSRNGVLMDAAVTELQAGDVITSATNETAAIVYRSEATRLELQPGTVLVFGEATEGKRFELRTGIVQARVAPQPAGQSFRIKTPHARATVLGTEFLLRADENTTRLDVLEGKVQLACRITGKKVVVKAGFGASMKGEKSEFSVTPLCSSNCILRECRGTNAESKFQKLKANDKE